MTRDIKNIVKAYYDSIPTAERHEGGWYVTLYCEVSFYGGPQEGGWWGHDTVAAASQHYGTRDEGMKALKAVQDAAEGLTKDAERAHGARCLQEMDWLDQRGLDADFLPEVAGADGYFAVVERHAGSKAHVEDRRWC